MNIEICSKCKFNNEHVFVDYFSDKTTIKRFDGYTNCCYFYVIEENSKKRIRDYSRPKVTFTDILSIYGKKLKYSKSSFNCKYKFEYEVIDEYRNM